VPDRVDVRSASSTGDSRRCADDSTEQRRYGTCVGGECHTHDVVTRSELDRQPPWWPPLLAVLGGVIVGYVSFIAAATACLAESITAFGTTGCTGPLWTTVGLLAASVAVLLGGILLVTRVAMRARGSHDGS
jgi:hypothetical protein